MRIRSARTILALLAAAGALLAAGPSSVQGSALEHERLRVRNTFKTPEEVVSYYCARDASGFVWSGLLDAERTAFTLWSEAPQQDSFFIARRYEVNPATLNGSDRSRAKVEVRYELAAVGDANGGRMPPPGPEMRVIFDLKKVGSVWKIAKPDPSTLAPVVLESKFPVTSTQ